MFYGFLVLKHNEQCFKFVFSFCFCFVCCFCLCLVFVCCFCLFVWFFWGEGDGGCLFVCLLACFFVFIPGKTSPFLWRRIVVLPTLSFYGHIFKDYVNIYVYDLFILSVIQCMDVHHFIQGFSVLSNICTAKEASKFHVETQSHKDTIHKSQVSI